MLGFFQNTHGAAEAGAMWNSGSWGGSGRCRLPFPVASPLARELAGLITHEPMIVVDYCPYMDKYGPASGNLWGLFVIARQI